MALNPTGGYTSASTVDNQAARYGVSYANFPAPGGGFNYAYNPLPALSVFPDPNSQTSLVRFHSTNLPCCFPHSFLWWLWI